MSRLKLEQKKNSKLKLTVKNRTKILTKDFVFALSIAFFVHFLAFTLFHIDLGLFSTTREYPIAFVQTSDLSAPIDSADLDGKPLTIPSFLAIAAPSGPEYPSLIPSSEVAFTSNKTSFDLDGLEIALLSQSSSSHFHLSGGNSFQSEPAALKSKNLCRAKLAFKANPNNGTIFWLDWIESTGDNKLDYQIQEALKQAQLKRADEPIASHGTIEIEFKA